MWSYILAAVGLAGLYLTGNKRAVGFLVGVGAQVLWITFAVTTEQYGFISTALVYGSMYWRNFVRWKREEKEERERRP